MSNETDQTPVQETELSEEAKKQQNDIQTVIETYRLFVNKFREFERTLRKAARSATVEEAALWEIHALGLIEEIKQNITKFPDLDHEIMTRVQERAEKGSPKRVEISEDEKNGSKENRG
jgi:hypothetical protein